MKFQWMLKIGFLIFAFMVIWQLINSSPVRDYVAVIKQNQVVKGESKKDALYQYIGEEAKNKRISPINAKVDRVWKAVPGYNGLEVDVDATYRLAKENKEDVPSKWIYKQVIPDVTLEELPPNPIYRGNPEKPMVSFMINVAWGTEYLPSILETLEQNDIHTTFFFDGSWLNKNTETAKRIVEADHEIGNHAYSHPAMSRLSETKMRQEIVQTQDLIQSKLNITSKLFAPPSGDYNQRVVQIAGEYDLYTVLWTEDTLDWKRPDPSVIIQRVAPNLGNGVLVLMHPTEPTTKALPVLIKKAKEKGLQIGPVSEVLSSSRLADPDGNESYYGLGR